MNSYHVTKENNNWYVQKNRSNRPSIIATPKKEIVEQTHLFIDDQFYLGKINSEEVKSQDYIYKRKDDPQNIRR